MNEIAIKDHDTMLQSDELSRAMYSCSMLARKIIAFGAVRIKETEIDTTPFWSESRTCIYVPAAEFRISELLKALGMVNSGENYLAIKKTVKEMRTLGIDLIDNDDEYLGYNWFQTIHYNKAKDKIVMQFSQEIGWCLYNLKDGYTALNLRTVGEFKSFYAFRFYEIALSWRGMKGRNGNKKGCWFFQMTVEELRKTFKIPDEAYNGRNDNFIRKVITIPIEELNKVNTDFSIEVLKIKRGREIVAFRFECKESEKETKKIAITRADSREIRQEKRDINSEQEAVAKLRKAHADRWQEVFDFEMTQPCLFGGEEIKKSFAENKANMTLLEEFKDEI